MKMSSDQPCRVTAASAVMSSLAAVLAPVAAAVAPAAVVVAPVVAAIVTATPAAAQTGPDIMRNMMERQLARLAGIENLLIEQEVMGVSTTMYLVKETVNGQPTLVPRMNIVGGEAMPISGEVPLNGWSGSPEFYVQWADRFELAGSGEVNGRPAYSLAITDFSGIDLGSPPGQSRAVTPSSLTLYLDRANLVPLQMEVEMEVDLPFGGEPAKFTLVLDDYEDVAGYLHPLKSLMSWDGLINLIGNDRDPAEVQQQLADLEERIRAASPAQRVMLERMVAPLREMLAGEPVETTVNRIEANVDPPTVR